MRRLVWLVTIVALLWCIWWLTATTLIQRGLSAYAAAPQGQGIAFDIAQIETSGFPMRLQAQLNDLRVVNVTPQSKITVPRLDISAPTYWPGYLTANFTGAPINLQSRGLSARIETSDGTAALRLRPGAKLQLQSMIVSANGVGIAVSGADFMTAGKSRATLLQHPGQRETYDIDFAIDGLTPGASLRALLNLPANWPDAFDALTAQATVKFDAPWDRSHLEAPPPQPRAIMVRRADVVWGPLNIAAAGDVTLDADGVPDGAFTLKISDGTVLLDMAQASGVLPVNLRQQADLMLQALSNLGGSQNGGLDLTLNFADGQMSLGPIRLGPAPRLRLTPPYSQ